MQVVSIEGYNARCEAKGVQRDVSLLLLQDESVQKDDFVIVHLGHAIRKITEEDARTAWQLFDQILALEPKSEQA